VTSGFAPPGYYLWDLWLIHHVDRYHLFHLQSPRTPQGLAERGDRATIGHASSSDLRHWAAHGTALEAGPPGSWDDLALWTGGIIARAGRFYMLYTGRQRAAPEIQRIGLAVSDDLIRWEKHPRNPVCVADPRWYDTLDTGRYPTEDWRDPYLYYDEPEDRYYALITARDRTSTAPYSGCVALATSSDLVTWECAPPLCSPGYYKEMECSQLVRDADGTFLVFSTHDFNYAPDWAERCGGAQTGAHVFAADDIRGEYRPIGPGVLLGSATSCYGTKICPSPADTQKHVALSWLLRTTDEPDFAGRLDRPRQVKLSRTFLQAE
jgi:beta-fructofuranosidase